MDTITPFLAQAGIVILHVILWLSCFAGILVSCVSFTGTWIIAAAAILAAWLSGSEFPGWVTVLLLFLISGVTEVIEALAGHWGVTRRGGSKAAGIAAVAGGLLGMVAGSLIPIPLIGPLLGVCAGSFGLSYLVERRHMRTHQEATQVAKGALLARVAVIVFKVAASIITSAILLGGFYFGLLH
ncbi:MAG: DUF456 domain-containing protein [Kiritimatiellia bacterium]|jgi:hypothetical protein|nr:DUF456 domain-containing protein [Kiritimatiellia bacterium]